MRISIAKYDARPSAIEKSILGQLTGNGFFEIMNNSLTRGSDYKLLQKDVTDTLIEVLNPLSQDLNIMRNNLIFGGLEAISFNQKRQQTNLRFFERGKTYGKGKSGYFENAVLDLFCAGNSNTHHWNSAPNPNDFFFMKGLVEGLFNGLGLSLVMVPKSTVFYNEYLSLKIGKTTIGHMGSVHPKVRHHFDIKEGVFHASLLWETITALKINSGSKPF